MNSVATVRLGDLMVRRSSTITPRQFPDEAFDLYSIPAYDDGVPIITLGRDIGSAKQVVQEGDVLLSKIVPHIRRAWIVQPATDRRVVASSEWIVFRSSALHPPYLRRALLSDRFHAQFMGTVSGVGGSLLRARPSFVAGIEIPVPALEEQRRIAEVLDRADELRAKRRQALAQLDDLTQSIFLDMFGDPLWNSHGWPDSLTLGGVAQITSGITKGRKLRTSHTRNVPYLAVANVQDMRLDLSVVKTIEATDDEIRKYRLQLDDILLTEGGDPDKLGRGTLWNEELPEAIHQNHIFRVRVVDVDLIHPTFLLWLIGSARGKHYFLKSAKQTTGIASINRRQLQEFRLLLPPIEHQRESARRVNEVEQAKAEQRGQLEELDRLFAALQDRAFRGEL